MIHPSVRATDFRVIVVSSFFFCPSPHVHPAADSFGSAFKTYCLYLLQDTALAQPLWFLARPRNSLQQVSQLPLLCIFFTQQPE